MTMYRCEVTVCRDDNPTDPFTRRAETFTVAAERGDELAAVLAAVTATLLPRQQHILHHQQATDLAAALGFVGFHPTEDQQPPGPS